MGARRVRGRRARSPTPSTGLPPPVPPLPGASAAGGSEGGSAGVCTPLRGMQGLVALRGGLSTVAFCAYAVGVWQTVQVMQVS